jgi:uncharacterized repeat protein (TIGR03847 family)
VTRRRFIFDPPDRFVAGTVGRPGQRTFLLQAREGRRIVSVVLEKTQVAVLADRLGQLLEDLQEGGSLAPPGGQTVHPGGAGDSAPLDEPLNEAFRAAALTLGWDAGAERILIEARSEAAASDEELAELLDDEDEDGPDLLRVRLTAGAARSFVDRAVQVINAGRPPCPLCGRPLEPQGHICPRRNGSYVH